MAESIIDILATKNAQLNELKKEVDKLKAEVKSQGVGNYQGNEYEAIVENRTASKLDLEKALEVAKDNNIKWVIKETIDEEALEDSIAQGEIDGSLFADCITEKTTTAIKFKKIMR